MKIKLLTRVSAILVLVLIMTLPCIVNVYALQPGDHARITQEIMQRREAQRRAAQREETVRAIGTFVLIASVVGGIWAIVYLLNKKNNTSTQTTNDNINHYQSKSVSKFNPSPRKAYLFCTECGNQIVEKNKFCSGCGGKVKVDT